MNKRPIGSAERGQWTKLKYNAEQLEKLKDVEKYGTEVRKNFRMAYTYLVKALEGLNEEYPDAFRKSVEDMEYYRLLILPKREAEERHKEMIKKAKKDPLNVLYDVLDWFTIPQNCKGCKGKQECGLKELFTVYDIPCVDENDIVCKYRYEES